MITKNLDPNALASATSISFKQKIQTTDAFARNEKIVVIGNFQDEKEGILENVMKQFYNADDVAINYGFGSPLHRMALKLFPFDGNGSKVNTYFLPINGNGIKHKISVNIIGSPNKNFTCYLRFKEMNFEAPADVVGKIATHYQLNPAVAPRKMNLNIFNKVLIPFTILKNDKEENILNSLKQTIEEFVDVPFVANIQSDLAVSPIINSIEEIDINNLTENNYKILYSINNKEPIEKTIGGFENLTTIQDLVTTLNNKLDDLVFSAENLEVTKSTISVATKETGSNTSLQILSINDETDLFKALSLQGKAFGSDAGSLIITSKWKGETAKFEIDFVNDNQEIIDVAKYGLAFTIMTINEATGLVNISNALNVITTEHEITRVLCQFNDNLNLDRLKDKFMSFRNGLICQWVLAYTGRNFTEDPIISKKVNLQELIDFGNSRNDDSVNIIIAGAYGDLKNLEYLERDNLLKAGISNLEPKVNGGYRIGDLITLYHPIGSKTPIFRYDRDITVIANIGYDLMYIFRDSEAWSSIVIVSENLYTTNEKARKISDLKAELDTRLRLYGKNAWIADVDNAIKNSAVELDSNNPNRFNINPSFELSGVGRIYDIVNFVGFYFKSE